MVNRALLYTIECIIITICCIKVNSMRIIMGNLNCCKRRGISGDTKNKYSEIGADAIKINSNPPPVYLEPFPVTGLQKFLT